MTHATISGDFETPGVVGALPEKTLPARFAHMEKVRNMLSFLHPDGPIKTPPLGDSAVEPSDIES